MRCFFVYLSKAGATRASAEALANELKKSVDMWEYLKSDIWKLAQVLVALFVSLLVAWKIVWSANLVNIDFATLLSVLLAFFSVSLSVVFYFKATDTSNAFYDNTYKFTQDIAGLLVRIESGFGEKLKNIDDNYVRMRNYFESGQGPSDLKDDIKEDLRAEKEQFKKVLEERDALIQELLAKTNMQEGERLEFENLLKEKDEALKKLNREVSRMSRDLTVDRVLTRQASSDRLRGRVEKYIRKSVIFDLFKHSRARFSSGLIKRRFSEALEDFPLQFLSDMEKLEYLHDGALTDAGVDAIAEALRERREDAL
jgi:hypothetical protein